MDIVITARHTEVSERFRAQAEEKLAKVSQLAPRAQRVDVEVSHERNPRQAQTCKKVEITVRDRGPVIRAEATADEPYTALDMALGKLQERLRRSRDRRKVHRGRQTPASLRTAPPDAAALGVVPTTGPLPVAVEEDDALGRSGAGAATAAQDGDASGEWDGESPVVIRTKDHEARPMTLDQALYEMELVGHDFFLFVEAESGHPCVVYRRRGWNYGLIRLHVDEAAAEAERDAVLASR